MCRGKTQIRSGNRGTYQTEHLTSGYSSNMCSISVASAVVTLDNLLKVPVLIMNSKNQTMTLRRGCYVDNLIKGTKISEISGADKTTHYFTDGELSKVEVPLEYGEGVMALLKKNVGLFTSEDKDLGRTDTLKMKN